MQLRVRRANLNQRTRSRVYTTIIAAITVGTIAVLIADSTSAGPPAIAAWSFGSNTTPAQPASLTSPTPSPNGFANLPPETIAAGRATAMPTLPQQETTRCLMGVDCNGCRMGGEPSWDDRKLVPWEAYRQGEYVGPFRSVHVPVYRLRVDDELEFVYRLTRIESSQPYELNVGDQVRIESLIDPTLDRDLVIQPDGMITLRMLGQVRAARRTVAELCADLEEQYTRYYPDPGITVTPLQVNTRLEDLRAAVDSRFGQTGGQAQMSRVTPEGTIQLPAIGSVPAQGLTLSELKQEIDERYVRIVNGIGVTPRLVRRAPRFVYVVGEVRQPGRFILEAPTTAMQAIALAGGWNNGGNLRQIVVFRRTADWQLMATKLDLRGALLGERPCPADEMWLRDSDIVVVPKSELLRTNNFIELLFTRGIYGVIPMQGISLNFQKLSSL